MTMNIPQTALNIHNAIGGNAAYRMMGAKPSCRMDGLQWKMGGGIKGPHGLVTHVDVAYVSGTDTYTVTTYRIRGTSMKTLATEEGVYVDALKSTVERLTGCILTMPRIVRV